MTEILILLFILFIAYVIFGSSKGQETPSRAPVSQAKPEPTSEHKPTPVQPVAPADSRAKPDKPAATAHVTPSTPQTVHKNTSPKTATPVTAALEKSVPELVGITAGNIWHYLDKNGTTTVAKLIRELDDNEKTIQRSIGWLAQEDKIILELVNRSETISLKT